MDVDGADWLVYGRLDLFKMFACVRGDSPLCLGILESFFFLPVVWGYDSKKRDRFHRSIDAV